jgi:hypothetical protein
MQSVTEQQVRALRIPEHVLDASVHRDSSSRFHPLSHGEVLDQLDAAVIRSGLKVKKNGQGEFIRRFTLTGNSKQKNEQASRMSCQMPLANPIDSESRLMIGVINSWDKSLSLRLAIGSEVFVCTNGCVFGEKTVSKKHTTNVLHNLPLELDCALSQVKSHKEFQKDFFSKLRGSEIGDKDAAWLIMQAATESVDAISPSQSVRTYNEWLEPQHEEFRTFANDVKSVEDRLAEDENYLRLAAAIN